MGQANLLARVSAALVGLLAALTVLAAGGASAQPRQQPASPTDAAAMQTIYNDAQSEIDNVVSAVLKTGARCLTPDQIGHVRAIVAKARNALAQYAISHATSGFSEGASNTEIAEHLEGQLDSLESQVTIAFPPCPPPPAPLAAPPPPSSEKPPVAPPVAPPPPATGPAPPAGNAPINNPCLTPEEEKRLEELEGQLRQAQAEVDRALNEKSHLEQTVQDEESALGDPGLDPTEKADIQTELNQNKSEIGRLEHQLESSTAELGSLGLEVQKLRDKKCPPPPANAPGPPPGPNPPPPSPPSNPSPPPPAPPSGRTSMSPTSPSPTTGEAGAAAISLASPLELAVMGKANALRADP